MLIKVATATIAIYGAAVGCAAAKAPPPAFTWTGFYLGLDHGYGGADVGADASRIDRGAFSAAQAAPFGARMSGFFAGGQIGYDRQFENDVVLGVSTDLQWSGIRAKALDTNYGSAAGAAAAGFADDQFGVDWFGATRLRAGYAFGVLLPYVTGGVAYGSVFLRNRDGAANTAGAYSYGAAAGSAVRLGWTAGAGVEVAVADGMSLFGEYSYLELGGLSGPLLQSTPAAIGAGQFRSGNFGAHLLRAGVNWRPGDLAHAGRVVSDPGAALQSLIATTFAAPAVDWTGFYGGLNGGYGGGEWRGDFQSIDARFGDLAASTTTARAGGFLIGGQLGYNRQYGHWVIGVETDMQWSDMQSRDWRSGASVASVPGGALATLGPNQSRHTNVDWFGTTRLRLGWASGRLLPYLTGGVAYGGLTSKSTVYYAATNGQFDVGDARSSTTRVGWAVGSGVDYALTDTVSLRSEYVYTELQGITRNSYETYNTLRPPPAFADATIVGRLSTRPFGTHVFRGGVNVRFSGP
jgi:outer membrane immunogenic protein